MIFDSIALASGIALAISSKNLSPEYTLLIVVPILRYMIDSFFYFYYDMYVPKPLRENKKELDERTKRFMRYSEFYSQRCPAGIFCTSTDIEHILKNHDILHSPTTKCDPANWCRGGKGYMIGYHQTLPETALLIAETGFKAGASGLFGGGIYFARSIDDTFRKAHNFGALICAVVDMGNIKYVTQPEFEITKESLESEGFNSVYAKAAEGFLSKDEFVVYEPERVKKWIIIYNDMSKNQVSAIA